MLIWQNHLPYILIYKCILWYYFYTLPYFFNLPYNNCCRTIRFFFYYCSSDFLLISIALSLSMHYSFLFLLFGDPCFSLIILYSLFLQFLYPFTWMHTQSLFFLLSLLPFLSSLLPFTLYHPCSSAHISYFPLHSLPPSLPSLSLSSLFLSRTLASLCLFLLFTLSLTLASLCLAAHSASASRSTEVSSVDFFSMDSWRSWNSVLFFPIFWSSFSNSCFCWSICQNNIL